MYDQFESLRRQVLQVLRDCSDDSRGMTVAEIAMATKADSDLVLVALYDLVPDIEMRRGASAFPGETGQPNNPVDTAAQQLCHYYRVSPAK